MDNDKKIEDLVKQVGEESVPDHINELADELSSEFIRRTMQEKQARSSRSVIISGIFSRRKYRVAAGFLLVTCLVVFFLFAYSPQSSIALAEVTERFASVPFYSMTIFFSGDDDPSVVSLAMKIWVGQNGKAKIQAGKEVKYLDGRSQKEAVESGGLMSLFASMIVSEGGFSLNSLMKMLTGWGNLEVSEMKTPANVTAGDLVYFEVESTMTPERLRIWVLRESKLPIRITFFDPRNDETTIFLFDYLEEQDNSFFEPPAKKSVLQNNLSSAGNIFEAVEDMAGAFKLAMDMAVIMSDAVSNLEPEMMQQ